MSDRWSAGFLKMIKSQNEKHAFACGIEGSAANLLTCQDFAPRHDAAARTSGPWKVLTALNVPQERTELDPHLGRNLAPG